MTATGVWLHDHVPDIVDVSKFGFEPIVRAHVGAPAIYVAAPVAVRQERGVDLGPLGHREVRDYVAARRKDEEAARRVRARILKRRGGVLPHNWTVVEHYKENVHRMARMCVSP